MKILFAVDGSSQSLAALETLVKSFVYFRETPELTLLYVHPPVPYKGAANAAVDRAAGQIQVMVSNYSTIAPLMRSGKIKALAVTSNRPQAAFPDLPPLATVARGFAVDIWVGVFAPAGTPAAIVERLNQEINAIAASPDRAPVLEPDGTLPEAISPAVFAGRIKDELGQWKQIATEHKIVAE
jgi:tripartite-type tricarboxylate transporter receptor subunit TctC